MPLNISSESFSGLPHHFVMVNEFCLSRFKQGDCVFHFDIAHQINLLIYAFIESFENPCRQCQLGFI